jgi:Ribbon-helix-helix domain
MSTVRWSLVVSRETDIALRTHLAQQGMRKGDLSRFVEEAVRWRVLDRTVDAARRRNRNANPAELDRLIDEAVTATRASHGQKRAAQPRARG